MKLKNIICGIVAGAALVSCEESHLNDNMYDPSVYIVNHGLNNEVFYVVEKNHTVMIDTYCGGIENIDPTVSVAVDEEALNKWNEANGTSLKMLPEDCYTLEATPKAMADARASFALDFNCDMLAAISEEEDFSDLTQYAVPVVIKSHTDGVITAAKEEITVSIVIPKMNLMSIFFEQAGKSNVDLSAFEDDGEFISYDFRIFTPVENHWDNEVEFVFNSETEGLDHNTLPEGTYTVTPSAEKFTEGVSEIKYNVKIKKDAVKDLFFTMTASVASKGDYILGGEGSATVNVFNRHYVDNKKVKIVSCNSFVPGREAALTIDGNKSTKWEAAYQDNHTGSLSLPFEIVYELPEEVEGFTGVEMYRRNDRFVTDLKAGNWYVSNDGIDWTKATSFDYGTSKDVGPLRHECDSPMRAKFLKFEVTESGRKTGAGVPIAHLNEVYFMYR